jgi:tetratricopeptide (TPR) repeat protein
MAQYAVAHLDDIEEVRHRGSPLRRVRVEFGITGFGVNAWTGGEAGERLIPEHDEDENEELYLVHRGRARFELDGEMLDAPAGTLVYARPDVSRTAFAEEPGTTIIAVGGTPGKAFDPGGWELWASVHPLYEAGRYEEAAERGNALLESNPRSGSVLYNVACCESLSGRPDEAIRHLRLAIERYDGCRALAANDSDFDPIRQRADFQELVGRP